MTPIVLFACPESDWKINLVATGERKQNQKLQKPFQELNIVELFKIHCIQWFGHITKHSQIWRPKRLIESEEGGKICGRKLGTKWR